MTALTVIMVAMFIISVTVRPAIALMAQADIDPTLSLLFFQAADLFFTIPVAYGLFHLVRHFWHRRKAWRWTEAKPFCPLCGQKFTSKQDAADHKCLYQQNTQRRINLGYLFLTLAIAAIATITIPFAIAASTNQAAPEPQQTPTVEQIFTPAATQVPVERSTVVVRVPTPTAKTPSPTPTPAPTPSPTASPQEDIDLFRELLLDDSVDQVVRRCDDELGGSTGIQALVDAYEGLTTKDTPGGWIIEQHGRIPADSQDLLTHSRELAEAVFHFEASSTRLAITLRDQGFYIPTDPTLEVQWISTTLFRRPFTDMQWLAIRKDAYRVLDAVIAFDDARLAYYRTLLPGCGEN